MEKHSKNLVFVLLFYFAAVSFCSADLNERISSLISKSDQKNVQYGISIIEASTGKEIFSSNQKLPLMPASNMKLASSAAAINYLGTDYQFQTAVGLCGNQLVIVGGGDPLFGDEQTLANHNLPKLWPVDDIVKLIKDANITELNNIIIDTTIFDDNRVHPAWPKEQLNQWYACEVSGLNFNDNCIGISVSNKNNNIAYSLDPQTGYLKITNQITPTSKKANSIGAYRSNEENSIYLKGQLNKSAQFTTAIERPSGFFAYLLAEKLMQAGVKINGRIIEGPKPEDCEFRSLKTYSTPISDVLLRCNQDSLGLAAESLVKTIASTGNPGGKLGSWEQGTAMVGNYLGKIGVDNTQYKIDDGSGLSRNNRLSAWTLVMVLKDLYQDQHKRDIIMPTLSVGGVSGTASKWFRENKYKGKILVKTGFINGVRSYSGICKTKSGDFLFSIITNNSNGKSREVMNKILEAIVDNYDN